MHDTDPNMRGNSRRWIMQEVEDEPATPADRLDRPVPDPPPGSRTDHEETLGALTDLVRRARCATSARRRTRRRRSSRPNGWRSGAASSGSSASSRPTRSSCAASRRRCCRRASATAWASSRGARSPAAGCPGGTGRARDIEPPAARIPAPLRPLDAREPARSSTPWTPRAARRRGGPELDPPRARFVLRHPAVTAAIIGPRTLEQLEEPARRGRRAAPDDVLDAIDEIVPPGTNLNPADAGWRPPQLDDPASRRR